MSIDAIVIPFKHFAWQLLSPLTIELTDIMSYSTKVYVTVISRQTPQSIYIPDNSSRCSHIHILSFEHRDLSSTIETQNSTYSCLYVFILYCTKVALSIGEPRAPHTLSHD